MMRKLVIGIPTYNRAEILLKLLHKLAKQIMQGKFESKINIFVSDNCSKDSTPDVIKDFSSTHKNIDISYHRNPSNIGWGKNFLKVLEKADAEYIWLMGDDDEPEEGALSKILGLIERNKPDAFVLNYKMRGSSHEGLEANKDEILGAKEFYSKYLYRTGSISICMYRKKSLRLPKESISLHNTHIEALVRVLRAGGQVYIVSDKLMNNSPGNWGRGLLLEYSSIDGQNMLNCLEPVLRPNMGNSVRSLPVYIAFAKMERTFDYSRDMGRIRKIYGTVFGAEAAALVPCYLWEIIYKLRQKLKYFNSIITP